MAWDSSRPVPWQRLMREWLVYVGLMAVVFLVFFRDNSLLGIFAGLLVSGPLYLALGYVLAKFGYQRRTLNQMRTEEPRGSSKRSSAKDQVDATRPRPKPAPTSRTGGAPSRRNAKRRR